MKDLASIPAGVLRETASRSMAPVETCVAERRGATADAAVPLPAPGAPRKTTIFFIETSSVDFIATQARKVF
jgi:hypothetical protein